MRHFNGMKTFGLFAVLWVIVLAVGGLISAGTRQAVWIWVFAALGLAMTFYTYWNSDKLALKQMRAYPVAREQAPQVYGIVEELTEQLDMPMPSIWIAPTLSPNAFATGRNPQNAAVCCTEGILQILNERQLRGVLAHEIMHVYNRDILTASVASAMAGLISLLAEFLLFFGLGSSSDDKERGGSAAGALFAAILAPMAAALIQMGISRTREYSADQDGATLTGDPLGLASALQALEVGTHTHPLQETPQTENASALMIANPFGGLKKAARLFSTHPPTEERVARLQQMAREMSGENLPPV